MRFKIPYLVGNKLLRNHINWPTVLRDEIPDIVPGPDPSLVDVIWPVDITFAQMMALVWRVKEWTFTANLTVNLALHINSPSADHTYLGNAVVTGGKVYPLKFDGANVVKADEEKYLVREYYTFGYKSVATPFRILGSRGVGFEDLGAAVAVWNTLQDGTFAFNGSTPANSGASGALQFSLFNVFPCLYNTITELFSPSFASQMIGTFIPFQIGGNQFFLTVQPTKVPINRPAATGTDSVLSEGAMTVSPGPFLAPDFDVPMQYATRTGGIGPLDTSSGDITGTMSLVAASYWPYQNGAGQPVYDEATGEQINPIF